MLGSVALVMSACGVQSSGEDMGGLKDQHTIRTSSRTDDMYDVDYSFKSM